MSNLFGTDGIRTSTGSSPLTLPDLSRIGIAIGKWAYQKYGKSCKILLASDTRISKDWITCTLLSGVLLYPITTSIAGTLPTPAVLRLIKQKKKFHVGIVISASHNPYQDNGIKIVDCENGKLDDKDELSISSLFYKTPSINYSSFGRTEQYPDAEMDYISSLISFFPSLSLKKKKIVIDCAHGATYKIAPLLLQSLGAHVITLNRTPNGKNINKACGSLELSPLQEAVLKERADLGCAFDGDGDRVMFVNTKGEIKNGDDILALLSSHSQYKNEKTVVGTVMSNYGLQVFLNEQSKSLVRTPVGDRWVAQYLNKRNLQLGGEQSGHIILHDYLPSGDGIATLLRTIEAIQETENWNLETFKTYPQTLVNLPVKIKKDLKEPSIAAIIAKYEKQLNAGRVYVRYSGTENLLRIMVEDREHKAVYRISKQLAQALKQKLQ